MAQVIEVVKVGVLTEGETDASREYRHLGFLVAGRGRTVGADHGVGRLETLVGQPGQVAGEPGAAAELQPPHFGVGEEPVQVQPVAQLADLREVARVPHPGPHDGADPEAVTREDGHDHLTERE